MTGTIEEHVKTYKVMITEDEAQATANALAFLFDRLTEGKIQMPTRQALLIHGMLTKMKVAVEGKPIIVRT